MLALRAPAVAWRTPAMARFTPAVFPRYSAFCSTPSAHLRDFFPIKETKSIQVTPPAWPHPGYTMEQMAAVIPAHRPPQTFGDHVAWRIVQLARYFMDLATGISREQKSNLENGPGATARKPLTEGQWLVRFVFLESVAGVPGMVGGMMRHLRSLRKLSRDNGWIETLLEESYNERMHLLTFMKMCEPGWFMRLMVMGAQGVFFNSLFVGYLIWPSVVHRFVGFLEEEAIHTYTRCLREIDMGYLPHWSDARFEIPEIAVSYWKIPEGHRTMRDLLLYVRCDEATHRSVNHTLGNLKQSDPNPFVSKYKEANRDAPLPALKPAGWTREEVI